jgi:hypothetical protein
MSLSPSGGRHRPLYLECTPGSPLAHLRVGPSCVGVRERALPGAPAGLARKMLSSSCTCFLLSLPHRVLLCPASASSSGPSCPPATEAARARPPQACRKGLGGPSTESGEHRDEAAPWQPSSGGEGSPTAGRPGEGTSAAEEQSEPREKAGRMGGGAEESMAVGFDLSNDVRGCGTLWWAMDARYCNH